MPLSISALLIADLLVVLDGTPSRLSAAHHSAAALPKRVWIATDPDHTARAVLNAQIALGPCGIQLGPLLPPPSPAEAANSCAMPSASSSGAPPAAQTPGWSPM
jgi:hypothetical protein